jgi:ribose transport system substrate-binding protein
VTAVAVACAGATSGQAAGVPHASTIGAIKADIAKYSKQPTAVPPGPAFAATRARGKVVWTIPTSSTVPVIKLENDAITAAMKNVGVQVMNYSTDGSPDSWVSAMNQAIGHKANLIIIEGIDTKLIGPQLRAAQSAHIPVIWDWAIEGPVSKVAPDVTVTNPLPFTISAKLMGELAVLQTGSKANVELYGLTTQRQDPVYKNGIKSALTASCHACSITGYTNAPIQNWSTHLTEQTRNLIASHPKVNVILPFYDGMVEFVAPGVTEAGAGGKVRIITHDGTPAVLDLIRTGNVVTADVGYSLSWQGWAVSDQALRILTGTKPLTNEDIPVRIWTKQNILQATGPNDENGYGNSYVAMYERLWGVKK